MSDAKPRTVWTASPLRFFHFFPLQLCLFSFLPPPRTFQQIYFTSEQSSFSLSLSLHISESPLAIILPFSTIQSQVAHPSATAQPHISPRFYPASFHLPFSPSTGNENKIKIKINNRRNTEADKLFDISAWLYALSTILISVTGVWRWASRKCDPLISDALERRNGGTAGTIESHCGIMEEKGILLSLGIFSIMDGEYIPPSDLRVMLPPSPPSYRGWCWCLRIWCAVLTYQ